MPDATPRADIHPGAAEFGLLLKQYREREELSQRKAARILGIDESTVARIEAGTRKPPRDVSFYERLRDLPGITETEIAALLRTDDAPRWLVAERDTLSGSSRMITRPVVAKVRDTRVIIQLEDETGLLGGESEIERVKEILKQDVEACLEDYLRLKDARAERLNAAISGGDPEG